MLQLASKSLDFTTQSVLDELQNQVNLVTPFKARVAKAQSLWDTKGGQRGKTAFITIKKELLSLCTFVGICNYCEQSEANDIEHIGTKSFFPEWTFVWENYLLVCKHCNTALKLDKCFVLDAQNDLVALNRGEEPPFQTIAFINPRIENPNDYMILDVLDDKFKLLNSLNLQQTNKAIATLQILNLNGRDTLLEARKSARKHYYFVLKNLIDLQNAPTKAIFRDLLEPDDDRFDFSRTLEALKAEVKENIKNYMIRYQHPSVWYALKMQASKNNLKWKRLFEQLPEVLDW
jgi:uncharacterized protein (TIGR02646 family)